MNRNVALNLLLAATMGTADSIWTGTMLVALLSALTNDSNTKIGLVTAVQGAAQIAAALPAGWAADRYSRSLILRVGGVAMILSVGLLAYTVVASESDSDSTAFNLIFAGLALFGFAQAIVNGPAQALLADSLPTGFRDTFYGYLMACYLIGSAVGPLLAIILFSIWQGYTTDDDDWPVKDLRIVILIGLALEVPSAYILFLFQDDQSLGKESRGISEANPLAEQGLLSDADELKAPTAEPEEVESEEATDLEWDAWMLEASKMKGVFCLKLQHIPYIVFVCDLVIATGSGMTIKFFPLFFKDDCGMSPAEVQTIYAIVPVAMAIAGSIGAWVSSSGLIGRAQVVVLLRMMGLSCFGALVVFYHYKFNKWLVVVAYILRTVFMNATYPLEESILMDYVPKKQRARWKSLESVSSFGWCGSAFIGGYLADKYDYTTTFIITIAIQTMATVMYSLLCTLVINKPPSQPKKDSTLQGESNVASIANTNTGND